MARVTGVTLTLAEAAEALREYAARERKLEDPTDITEVYVQSYGKTRVYVEFKDREYAGKFTTFDCPGHRFE